MEQRISFVTLASRDLAASRRFYVEGLGWTPHLEVPGEVLMLQAGDHLVLSLWDAAAFEAEVGPLDWGNGAPPITLSHNVRDRADVDEILELATGLGATVSDGQERDWGGYTGYFSDPDGFRWEIAYNPDPSLSAIVLPD